MEPTADGAALGMELLQWRYERGFWEEIQSRNRAIVEGEEIERTRTTPVAMLATALLVMIGVWVPVFVAAILPAVVVVGVAVLVWLILRNRPGHGTIPAIDEPEPPVVVITSTGIVFGGREWHWRGKGRSLRQVGVTPLQPPRPEEIGSLRLVFPREAIIVPIPPGLEHDVRDIARMLQHRTGQRTAEAGQLAYEPPGWSGWVAVRGAFVGAAVGYWALAVLRVEVWRELPASGWWAIACGGTLATSAAVAVLACRITPNAAKTSRFAVPEIYQYLFLILAVVVGYTAVDHRYSARRVIYRADAALFERLVHRNDVDWDELGLEDAMVALHGGMSAAFCHVINHERDVDRLETAEQVLARKDGVATECLLRHDSITGELGTHWSLCALLSDIDVPGLELLLEHGLDPNRPLRCPMQRLYPDWKHEKAYWQRRPRAHWRTFGSGEREPQVLSPLFVVALRDEPALIGLLLDAGANPGPKTLDLVSDRRIAGRLRLANGSWTPLEKLLLENDPAVLEHLEVREHLRGKKRRGLMDAALRTGADRVVEALLRDYGVPLPQPEWKTLVVAAEAQSAHLVATLLRLGVACDAKAVPDEVPTAYHRSFSPFAPPVVMTPNKKHSEFLRPVNDWGVAISEVLYRHAASAGKIRLAAAIDAHHNRWTNVFELVVHQEHDPLQRRLALEPEALQQRDARGRTPLMVAVDYGLITTFEVLMEYEPPLDIENDAGDTALMIAARKGYGEMVDSLLGRGASLTNRANPTCAAALREAKTALGPELFRGAGVSQPYGFPAEPSREAKLLADMWHAAEASNLPECSP